jgi:uncharacterized protein
MPKRDDVIFGAPCWLDLSTSDIERAAAFYGRLFGWTASDTGAAFGHYTNMSKDGALVAALSPKMDPAQADVPDAWNLYFAVPDAMKAAEAVTQAGGTLLFDVMQIDTAGRMTMFSDPTGAILGVWEPGTHRGFGLVNEAGAPCWFELLTRDPDSAASFYADTLDVRVSDMDTGEADLPYWSLDVAGIAMAGLVDIRGRLPDTVPASWSVYFGVDDVDAAVRIVEREGGQVIVPPVDAPAGRRATVTDPMGAVFVIIGV